MASSTDSAAGMHGAMVAVHTHEHSSYSTDGGLHTHQHRHDGDGLHDHAHDQAGAPGRPGGDAMPQVHLAGQVQGGETRGASLAGVAVRYLEGQGVDVGRELRLAELDRQAAERAARAGASRLQSLAIALKKARGELDAEMAGWRNRWTGHTLGSVDARMAEVNRLRSELAEACCHDERLIADVRRSVA